LNRLFERKAYHMHTLQFVLLLYLSFFVANAYPDTVAKKLNEQSLLKEHRSKSANRLRNEAVMNADVLNASLIQEEYQSYLKISGQSKNSNETASSNYQPILTPYQEWSVGIEKKIPLGVTLGVNAFGSQYSTSDGSVNDATTVGAGVSARLDLWKNIFGRLDRSKIKSAEAKKIRSEFQNKINDKQSEVQVRKAFWSFVAVQQSMELTKKLIESAEKQLRDAKARAQSGVADRGEVARYQSQLESRNSTLLLFQYESDLTTQYLEKDVSDFRISEWVLDTEFDKFSQPLVEKCIASLAEAVKSNPLPDLEQTYYDELIGTVIAEQEAEVNIASKHGDIDFSLIGQYQTSGVADTYSNAQDNQIDEQNSGTSIGLQLTIPLEGDSRRSEKALLKVKQVGLDAEKQTLMSEIRSTHETILKAVALLTSGLKRQVENSKNLEISYKEVDKKFKQGRVPVTTLIIEQDSLFNSQLQEIALKKQIAHVLLDYFSVFTNNKCEWNKI
jgi:outer membrane protein TolC